MKIVQLLSGRGVNGAVIQALRLIQALHERGHEVSVVGLEKSWIRTQLAGSSINYFPSTLDRWPLSELRRVASWINQQQADLLHTHNTSGQIFGTLLKGWIRVPVVATAHHTKLHAYWMFNDFVIANSEHTRRAHVRWSRVHPSRVETIRCLIDHTPEPSDIERQRLAWRTQYGFTPEDKVVAIVGDVCPRKNHLMLVDAMPQVLRQVPQAKVAIVGNQHRSYATKVKAAIADKSLDQQIRFVSFQDDVPAMMRAIDLLVACPTDEPFGLTPPEAMAASRPVVATRVGGLVESVDDGVTGYLVPKNDSSALATAIVRVLNDTHHAAELGSAGRNRFLQMFDNARNITRHEELYSQLVGCKPSYLPTRLRRAA